MLILEKLIEDDSREVLQSTTLSVKPALSLIVPTYNESENIIELVNRIEDMLRSISFELIIVDDNSPDGTYKIAEALNAKYGNIRVSKRSGKLGLSSALLHGFKESNAEVLAVMDADMQHPPEILPKMYNKISRGYDLVVASRYVDGGGAENWKLYRAIISKGATMLAHILLPNTRRVKDVMSGCFMLRKNVIDGVSLNPVGFKILLEMLAKCKFHLIIEVPYTFRNRQNGNSNLNLKEIQNYVVHLFKICCLSLRHAY